MQIRCAWAFVLFAALIAMVGLANPALAASSPFGVALPESGGVANAGLWGEVQGWILAYQADFYLALKDMVRAIDEEPSALLALLGLSFAYGAFHAAGPGHGKVVLTTYLFACGATARRGALLALIAALVQASVAVGLIAVAALLLNLTSFVITQTAQFLELASYALFVLLGFWLLSRAWRAAFAMTEKPGDYDHHNHSHDHGHPHHDHSHHDHEDGSCSCGHSHAPSLEMADQARSFKAMALAVFSMGLRPCSGALIVLVFALSQQVFWAGILSAYAMGIGTGLTIAVLALFAVYARHVSQKIAGRSLSHRAFDWLGVGILAFAGLIVAAFGGVLLAANLL
ncbi:MAG: nickel/cobalt transporter [Cohaesibacter sp.]|nr:nickel/cobalt transporter [Cohaesibacter sp.]